MSTAAGLAAAAKKVARHRAASNKEDPQHTWNQQLMEACLAGDVGRVEELVDRGADPVHAREVPPQSFFLGPLGIALQDQQQQQQMAERRAGEVEAAVKAAGNDAHGEAFRGYDGPAGSAGGDGAGVDGAVAVSAAAGAATAGAAIERLSPLAAMLLSGLDTLNARRVIAFLLQRGASVNDTFTFARARDEATEDDAAGAGGDEGTAAAGTRPSNAESKKSAKKMASTVASRVDSAAQSTAAAAAAAVATSAGEAGESRAAPGSEDLSVDGTVLHYVVSRGDHAQLLRLLLLAGGPTPPTKHNNSSEVSVALPYSLLHAVEQETVVGALRYQQLASLPQFARLLSGNTSPENSTAAATAKSASNGGQQQRGKGKQGGSNSSPTPPPTSAPVSPSHTITTDSDAAIRSAALTISSSEAEAVLAAFQQRQQDQQQQRHVSARVVRGLPILMSAYPHLPHDEVAATMPGATAADISASLWNLRKLCHDDSTTSNTNTPQEGTSSLQQPLAQRIELDLAKVDSHGYTAATIALHRGDTLSLRLLHFFGAVMPFDGFVNAVQTRLARACSKGDVARVEYLLHQGDCLAQISADGRYTLIHYAAAHPAVLKVLTERGLSLEYENAFGETAVLSLLRHGTARNDAKYVQTLYGTATGAAMGAAGGGRGAAEGGSVFANTSSNSAGSNAHAAATGLPATPLLSAAVSNAVAFAQLSPSAQRNYILCPPLQLPALTAAGAGGGGGGGGAGGASGGGGFSSRVATTKERSTSASARCASANPSAAMSHVVKGAGIMGHGSHGAPQQAEQPFLGGREAGTWWSFLPPTATTAEVLDTLFKAGAVLQGYVPDDDLDLPYVHFAEVQNAAVAAAVASAAGTTTANEGRRISDEYGEGEEVDDESYASHASLSGSASTAVPNVYSSSGGVKSGAMLKQRPQPFPGRLPLRVTPLQQAIFDYHPELVRRLVIDYRVDPMQRDSQGATAIHYAALCMHAPSVLELLLSPQVMLMHARSGGSGVTSAAGGAASASALGGASGSPNEAVISVPAALASKVDINGIDMAGRTPLFYAALVGNIEAVKLLLRFGALAQVGRADRDGWTPLHVAVRRQHPAVVELLLRHTKQLLSSAAAGGSDLLSEVLLASPATASSPGSSGGGRRVSPRGGGLRTLHHTASVTGGSRLRRSGSNPTTSAAAAAAGTGALGPGASPTDLLLANGAVALADVEAEDRVTHMTPLEMLIKQTTPQVPASPTQLRIATALLAEGQASSIRPSGLPTGGSLLHRVVADGQVELTELLLSYYADPDEVDDVDETPLFLAVRQSPPPTSHARDKAATDKNTNESDRQNTRRRTSLVRVLLQYGATPFAQSGTNLETPQHLAARSLAGPADDIEELLQMLFYVAPDRKSAAAGIGARRRWSDGRSKTHEHRVLSHVLSMMDAENSQTHWHGSRRGVGAKESALRRRLNRSGSDGSRTGRRRSSQESNGRERRGLKTQGQQQQLSTSFLTAAPPRGTGATGSGSARRKLWADDTADVLDGAAGLHAVDGLADNQLSFVNSSFASAGNNTSVFGDEDDRSAVTSRPESPEGSTTAARAAVGEADGTESSADQRRAVLRQWQTADHLWSPSHCWLLTNAQGQTLLHVLCSSACRAVQQLPAVVKLLTDLQAVTLMRDTSNGSSGSHGDVLSILWSMPDAQGRTPLHAAAQSGFAEAMEIILQMSPRCVAAVDAQGRTPLHACVLMASSGGNSVLADPSPQPPPSSGSATSEGERDDAAEEAREKAYAERLHRVVCALRDALAKLLADGSAVQLQGQPLRRTGRDVLPTPFGAAAAADDDGEGVRGGFTRVTAALVQSSSITEQLQRWQKTRHWGAPTLMRGVGQEVEAVNKQLWMDAAASPSGVRSWTAYTQLSDGQGRTALLLAAELGNRTAARELLRQA
jgi:ankyrin repeat protein